MELNRADLHALMAIVFGVLVLQHFQLLLVFLYYHPEAPDQLLAVQQKHLIGAALLIANIGHRGYVLQNKRLDRGLPLVVLALDTIIILDVNFDNLVNKILHTFPLLLVRLQHSRVLEPLVRWAVGSDQGRCPSRAVVCKLAEIVPVVLLDAFINIVVVVVIVVEALGLVDVPTVVS